MNYLTLIIFNFLFIMLNMILHFFFDVLSKKLEISLECKREYLSHIFVIIYEAIIIIIFPSLLLIITKIFNERFSSTCIHADFVAFTYFQILLSRFIIWNLENFKGCIKSLLIINFFNSNIFFLLLILLLEIVILLTQKKICPKYVIPIIFLLNAMIYSSKFLYELNPVDFSLITKLICIIIPCLDLKFKLTSIKTIEFLKSSSINFNEKVSKENSKALMASIVHDLRNPVSAVHSIMSVLSNSKNITSEERDQLESALFSCDFQLTIINNILDMHKIQANKFQMLHTEFSLPKELQMILKMQANVARKKNICFKSNILNTLPEIIVGDKNRIGQILFNIIGNSIKFTSEGEINVNLKWERNWSEIELTNESMMHSLKGVSESGEIGSLYINELISVNKATSKRELNTDYSKGEEVKKEMSVLQKMNHYFPLKKGRVNFGKLLCQCKMINSEENKRNKEGFFGTYLLTEVQNSKRTRLLSKEYHSPKIDLSKINDLESGEENGILFIQITDTGEGIKEDEQGKLFQPYSQAKSNISVPGTGLGLWISKQLT